MAKVESLNLRKLDGNTCCEIHRTAIQRSKATF